MHTQLDFNTNFPVSALVNTYTYAQTHAQSHLDIHFLMRHRETTAASVLALHTQTPNITHFVETREVV